MQQVATLWCLTNPVTPDEVKAALVGVSGVSGPDGVTWASLKSIAKETLSSLFNIWMLAGELPGAIAQGITTLIPKVPEPTGPTQLRPITITSTVCRLYDRILARRQRGPSRSVHIKKVSYQMTVLT